MREMGEISSRDQRSRLILQQKKPLAYAKVATHPEKVERGECVAMIQMQYKYDCNFRCKHCSIESLKQKGRETLSLKDVKRIADQADAMGLASICISGGEPLMFKDLEDVVKGIGPDRFNIAMDTNGWMLSEKKVKWLVSIGIDRIQLSMDGMENMHDVFRGKGSGSWRRCIAALEYGKKHGLAIIINIVATKSLLDSGELERQLDYLAQFDNHVSILHAKPVGAFAGKHEEILNSKDFQYIQNLDRKYNISTHQSPNFGHNFGCFAVKRWLSITAYGDVMPCVWIPISIGNILEEDLADIVKRGLGIKWFSYNRKAGCLAGNKDEEFYKTILPQAVASQYTPIRWKDVKW